MEAHASAAPTMRCVIAANSRLRQVNFQNVGIDTKAIETVKLTNTSDAKLTGSVSGSGLKGTPFSVTAGRGAFHCRTEPHQEVTVKYTPTVQALSGINVSKSTIRTIRRR